MEPASSNKHKRKAEEAAAVSPRPKKNKKAAKHGGNTLAGNTVLGDEATTPSKQKEEGNLEPFNPSERKKIKEFMEKVNNGEIDTHHLSSKMKKFVNPERSKKEFAEYIKTTHLKHAATPGSQSHSQSQSQDVNNGSQSAAAAASEKGPDDESNEGAGVDFPTSGKLSSTEIAKIEEFQEKIRNGEIRAKVFALANELKEYVNPKRKNNNVFQNYVQRNNMKEELKDYLIPMNKDKPRPETKPSGKLTPVEEERVNDFVKKIKDGEIETTPTLLSKLMQKHVNPERKQSFFGNYIRRRNMKEELAAYLKDKKELASSKSKKKSSTAASSGDGGETQEKASSKKSRPVTSATETSMSPSSGPVAITADDNETSQSASTSVKAKSKPSRKRTASQDHTYVSNEASLNTDDSVWMMWTGEDENQEETRPVKIKVYEVLSRTTEECLSASLRVLVTPLDKSHETSFRLFVGVFTNLKPCNVALREAYSSLKARFPNASFEIISAADHASDDIPVSSRNASSAQKKSSTQVKKTKSANEKSSSVGGNAKNAQNSSQSKKPTGQKKGSTGKKEKSTTDTASEVAEQQDGNKSKTGSAEAADKNENGVYGDDSSSSSSAVETDSESDKESANGVEQKSSAQQQSNDSRTELDAFRRPQKSKDDDEDSSSSSSSDEEEQATTQPISQNKNTATKAKKSGEKDDSSDDDSDSSSTSEEELPEKGGLSELTGKTPKQGAGNQNKPKKIGNPFKRGEVPAPK